MGKWAKAVVPLSGIYCTARREKNDWDKCTKQIIYVCFIFGMLFIERKKNATGIQQCVSGLGQS